MSYQQGLQKLRAGDLVSAELLLRQATVERPNDPAVLAGLCIAVLHQGRAAAAEQFAKQAVALAPTNAHYWANFGACQFEQRHWPDAIFSFEKAIALDPQVAAIWSNLGAALLHENRLDEAEAAHERAIKLDVNQPNVLINYGLFLCQRGQSHRALTMFQQVLTANPQSAQAWTGAGLALRQRRKLDDAIAALRRAQQLAPQQLEVRFNLGLALLERDGANEAEIIAQELIKSHPHAAESWILQTAVAAKLGHLEVALSASQQAISLAPRNADALKNYGLLLRDAGQVDEALDIFRQALAFRPDSMPDWSNYLFTLHFSPTHDAAAIAREHQHWNDRHAAPLASQARPHPNDRSLERRLRLGYVSPCFRSHCQSLFTLPLFTAHDRSQFEIFCYSDVPSPDGWTDRVRSRADGWWNIVSHTDEEVAEQIRQDRIDVLIDLNMHMDLGRPLLFARRPAPVQVCWLAYPGTTGMAAIDYRLTDPYLDPPGENDHLYAEKSIRLPDTFWCYDTHTTEPAVNMLPAFERGHITFGNFNNLVKVTDKSLALWTPVLQQVANSRLLLLAPETSARNRVWDYFESRGISKSRIEFVTPRPQLEYLHLYHEIDITLDTLPYNGHTTSLDSYWMGVPVVTLVGHTIVGRAGLSQLTNLGLPELIAYTPEQFAATAAHLAADLPRLAALRTTLRKRIEKSPLMDTARFAKNLEAAYRQMWCRWCASGT